MLLSLSLRMSTMANIPQPVGQRLHPIIGDYAVIINLLTPNVNYSGRTAPLTSKVAFHIFIQQI